MTGFDERRERRGVRGDKLVQETSWTAVIRGDWTDRVKGQGEKHSGTVPVLVLSRVLSTR
jgi:hypothetical protein